MRRHINLYHYAIYTLLLLSLCHCKDSKKDKHSIKITKNKNGKRWMNNFSQNFMNSEPEQFGSLASPFSSSSSDSYGYNMGGTSSVGAAYKEPNFQGMEELKIPKQTYGTNDASQSNEAQDLAVYMKPGIGDKPSDMPDGMPGYGITGASLPTTNGIGTPMNLPSSHSNGKINAVSALLQDAIQDANLNPQSMHKQTSPSASSMELTAVSIANAMNNDEPAKMLDTSDTSSASLGSLHKADDDSNKALDKEPVTLSKEKNGKGGLMKEKTGSKYKEDKGKADSAPENSLDGKEKEKDKEEVKEKEKVKEKENEKEKVNVKEKENSKENGEKDEEKNAEVEKEIKETSSEVENKGKEESDKPKEKEKNTEDKKEKNELKKSKKKEETGARRQNYEDYIDSGNNHIEHIGLPALKAPVEFADSDEKDVMVDTTKEGSDISEDGSDKTPNKVKAKLVSSLRAALLKNVKELMGSDDAIEDTDGASKATVSDDKDSSKSSSSGEEDSAESSNKESSAADDTSSDLFESNLMKVDKKKLVHFIATMMKRNREKNSDDKEGKGSKEKSVQTSSAGKDKNENESTKTKQKEKEKSNQSSQAGGFADLYGNQDFLQISSPNGHESQTSYQSSSPHSKHHLKTSKYGMSLDPYAQIGLADPNNNDNGGSKASHTGRHSVHQSHEKKDEEEQDKDDSKTEKEEVKADQHKTTNSKEKEAEEKEDAAEKSAEMDRQKEKEERKEKETKLKKIAEEEQKEKDEKEEKLEDNAKLVKDEKEKAVKDEATKVEEEVEKERQELKKLKDEEKDEKEKQSALKASNAELEGKQKEKQEESDKEVKTNDDNDKPMKVQHGNYVHLVSPDLVDAIAENLKSGKGLSKEEESNKEGKEKLEEKKEEDKSDDPDTKEEGPNIQKLIENMREKLLGSSSKSKSKSTRRHNKGNNDDAYSSIGSVDPNVKKRAREKKHRVRHPHKH